MGSLRLKNAAIKERSTSYVRISYEDREGVATSPTALRYRIDCMTTGTEILGWTSVSPQPVNEIVITSDQNRIVNDQNPEEVRQMTVEATGADGPVVEVQRWRVENLLGTT